MVVWFCGGMVVQYGRSPRAEPRLVCSPAVDIICTFDDNDDDYITQEELQHSGLHTLMFN